jgi:4-diphosphocytidyl-2-C-methyl-D-erythritol kinase
MITLKAPAKINLTLEVIGKRPDGFHEIRSLIQAIDLYDTLHFSNSGNIEIACDMPGWSAKKSLVARALNLLKETTGCKQGVEINLEKRIPLSSGLGGDSSDAAAVLNGLNDLWKLSLSSEKLLSLVEWLGSDVPFFLRDGTALASGRGEIITPLPPLYKMWVILVVPNIVVTMGKTGRMYAALKPSHFTDGSITQKFVDTLHKDNKPDSSMLFNTFENIAFVIYSGLSVYKEHLLKLGAPYIHVAGSGPTLFSILDSKNQAEELLRRCQDQGMKAYLVRTL